MWLVTGNGNPNYNYFQCFAYGLFLIIISMDFVSATVKRDKVRRMVEKGTIKKILAKKQEETQKEVDSAGKHPAVTKDAGNVEERNGNAEDVGNGNGDEKAAKDVGTDQIDDADDKPEPVVVFL